MYVHVRNAHMGIIVTLLITTTTTAIRISPDPAVIKCLAKASLCGTATRDRSYYFSCTIFDKTVTTVLAVRCVQRP